MGKTSQNTTENQSEIASTTIPLVYRAHSLDTNNGFSLMARAPTYYLNEGKLIQNNPKMEKRRQESAQYISDMLLELRNLAKGNGLLTLQGLLEISYYEAFNNTNKVPVPRGEAEHLRALGEDARKSSVA
jgi:hypothetical protein